MLSEINTMSRQDRKNSLVFKSLGCLVEGGSNVMSKHGDFLPHPAILNEDWTYYFDSLMAHHCNMVSAESYDHICGVIGHVRMSYDEMSCNEYYNALWC